MANTKSAGALESITPNLVMGAIGLVNQGQVYDLGVEIFQGMPEIPGLARFNFAFTHTPEMTGKASPFQFSAEVISGAVHSSTHIDALVHVQQNDRIFGGHSIEDARSDAGWRLHGMETVAPILGRAIVIDIAKQLGKERLEDGFEIQTSDLQVALKNTDREVQRGDIVLIRTGKIKQFSDPDLYIKGQPGLGREAAIWLVEQGAVVIGSDTAGTEPLPLRDEKNTAHAAMLVDRGVHLIENLTLEGVSNDDVTEGLFVALPLKIRGATGSWIRPVLIT